MANLTGSAANDTMIGADAISDTLQGAAGNDLIFGYGSVAGGIGLPVPPLDPGGGGAADNDSLAGGDGNDTIRAGGGSDTLLGDAGADQLYGDDGNDTLDGGAGADKMVGGLGADRYIVDSASDVVTELAGEGFDRIVSSVSLTIAANVEVLQLFGTADINATGNADGNELSGNAGANILDGKAGADTMEGGKGDDTYIVDHVDDDVVEVWLGATGGTDRVLSSVTYTLTNLVERLTLTGAAAIDGTGNGSHNLITGNGAVNVLTGLSGNDTLDGGAGADSLAGGLHNDVYVIDNKLDSVTELAAQGTDTIRWLLTSELKLDSFANVENAMLLGAAAVKLTGTGEDNLLIGNAGANTIDGGAGDDTMIGGAGNDLYDLSGGGSDELIELAGGGIDGVVSGLAVFGLPDNIENLTLTGTDDLVAEGNALKNVITGNSGNNFLDGGGDGGDSMAGGAGADIYVVNAGDVVTESPDGGIDTVMWDSLGNYTLGANLERLTLQPAAGAATGTGNALDNRLTGNGFANILDGKAGADIMTGDLGDDVYVFDNAADSAVEDADEGIDEIRSSVALAAAAANVENYVFTGAAAVSFTANDLANRILGTAAADSIAGAGGADSLDGKAGADTMAGGIGNDTYVVDNLKDRVDETGGTGIDTVQSSIGFNLFTNGSTVLGSLENLELLGTALNGTGNDLANKIFGNGSANSLAGNGGADSLAGAGGNDTLDGGLGADVMVGGAGNDTYHVDDDGDLVFEEDKGGTDTIQLSEGSFSLYDTPFVENLTLTGTAFQATGNDLANILIGNDLDNVLRGGGGADKMTGGKGNDGYFVDNVGDVVTELADGGTSDLIDSSVTYTMPTGIELMNLSGDADINGTGNALANNIHGNDGDNVIDGKGGADTMDGAGGNDILIVDNIDDETSDSVPFDPGAIDEVRSSVSHGIGAGIENLTLTGAAAINGSGNGQDNKITGNSGANSLAGDAGNDTIEGDAGLDTLAGGDGSDVFLIRSLTAGKDRIEGFSFTDAGAGADRIDISDILVGYLDGISDPNDFVQILITGTATTIKVDANGLVGGSSFTDLAVISSPPPGGIEVADIIADSLILA